MTDKKGFDHAPGSWRRRALAVLASALIVAAAGCVVIPTPTPEPKYESIPPTPEMKMEWMAMLVAINTEPLNRALSEGWEVERADRTGSSNVLIYLLRRVSTGIPSTLTPTRIPIRTPEPTATASRR